MKIKFIGREGNILRKKMWTTIITATGVLLVSQIGFSLFAKSEVNNESAQIHCFKKDTSDCNGTQKVFALINTGKNKENNEQKDSSNVVFPTYKETIASEKDGWITVNNPTSALVLVNKQRKLPDNYIPPKLVVPNVHFSFNGADEKKHMTQVAATALEKLFKQGDKEGVHLFAVSGYRSYKRQVSVFQGHVKELGEQEAKKVSAIPGSSEHQTGLSIDVSAQSAKFLLTTDFGLTPEGKWLKENAHKFGFIIRYPKDKTKITGYSYEPWHIRYVGIPHATYIYKHNLALEETIK